MLRAGAPVLAQALDGAAARAVDFKAVGVPRLVGVPGPEAFQ